MFMTRQSTNIAMLETHSSPCWKMLFTYSNIHQRPQTHRVSRHSLPNVTAGPLTAPNWLKFNYYFYWSFCCCCFFIVPSEVFHMKPKTHAGHMMAIKNLISEGTSKWSAKILITGRYSHEVMQSYWGFKKFISSLVYSNAINTQTLTEMFACIEIIFRCYLYR